MTGAPRPGITLPGRRGQRWSVAALLAAAALALLPAVPAQAHDTLVSASPAPGATVRTVPRAVTLTFDETVLDYAGTTVLIVTGPDGATRHFETSCVRVDGRTVTAPVALGASGRYTVTWRVVSADGHPVSDTFAFMLARPAGTTAAHGSATGPSCGSGATSASGATARASAAVSPVVWVLLGVGGGLVVVLLAAVVVVAVLLNRRPATARRDDGSSSG